MLEMGKKNFGIFVLLFILIIAALGCISNENATGDAVSETPNIYDDAPSPAILHADTNSQESHIVNESNSTANESNSTVDETKPAVDERNYWETPDDTQKEAETVTIPSLQNENFKSSPSAIINTQNNVSFSLDDYKYEIKSGYWGKIIQITSTVYNNGHEPFKPKVIVWLHDVKDPKSEWSKPKAEFDFGVETLKQGEHASKEARVNIAFDDINLSKEFEIILVDGNGEGHRSIASVQTDFTPNK